MKRVLSLFVCLCMLCTMSVTVFAVDNYWVNSYDSEMQRVIMRTNGNVLTVEVLTYDGEDIFPMGVVTKSETDNTPFLIQKGDYSWSGSVEITGDCSVCVYDTNINTNINWMMKSVKIIKTDAGIKISEGDYQAVNDAVREKLYANTTNDIMVVNPLIQKATDEICAGKRTDIDKARAIYEWISENIAYDYTAYKNGLTSQLMYPTDIFLEKNAVCGGLSQLFKVMCNSQGIPAKVIGGRQANYNGVYGHAWSEFYTNGGNGVGAGWYLVDCTGGVRKGYDSGSFFDNFDIDDKYYNYTKSNYFMMDKKSVDTYFIYESELPYNLNEIDAANVSDWAVESIIDARKHGLLAEGLIRDDYNQAITRDYFADLIVQFIKSEYVNAKLATVNQNSQDYATVLSTARNEIETKLKDISKNNPAYTGDRMGMSPSSGTKMGMAFCNEVGIIAGKGDAGLCPNDTLTRGEAATMLVRLFNYMKEEGYTSNKYDLKSFAKINSGDYFRDHMDIPEWALDGCYGCKDKGIIKGDDNNRFLPNNQITAEQCIAIFVRILDQK